MIYIVERGSTKHDRNNPPPCANAKKKIFEITQELKPERSVQEYDKWVYKSWKGEGPAPTWRREGRNHRVENGDEKRDIDVELWTIEINSIEELTEFVKTEGNGQPVQFYEKSETVESMPYIMIADVYWV